MYKALSVAAVAALISYCYLHISPSLYQAYVSKQNSARPTPSNSTQNITEMALASMSRSVIQKVLSVETPEVRACLAVSTTRFLTRSPTTGCWCTRSAVHWKHETAQSHAVPNAGPLPRLGRCRFPGPPASRSSDSDLHARRVRLLPLLPSQRLIIYAQIEST